MVVWGSRYCPFWFDTKSKLGRVESFVKSLILGHFHLFHPFPPCMRDDFIFFPAWRGSLNNSFSSKKAMSIIKICPKMVPEVLSGLVGDKVSWTQRKISATKTSSHLQVVARTCGCRCVCYLWCRCCLNPPQAEWEWDRSIDKLFKTA